MIAGGSAGDDLKFQKTFASYNGTVVSDGAVILFVKTPLPFFIQKENIFKPTGSRTKITQADTRIRKISVRKYAAFIHRTDLTLQDFQATENRLDT